MNGPFPPNPMYVASQAMQMGKDGDAAEARIFRQIAMASMISVAGTALLNVALPAVRELKELLFPRSHTEREEHRRKKLTGRDFHER